MFDPVRVRSKDIFLHLSQLALYLQKMEKVRKKGTGVAKILNVDIFQAPKGRLFCSQWWDLTEIRIEQPFMHVLVICKNTEDPINPLVTNGLSHPCHLGESIFILGAPGVIFISFTFFDENLYSKQNIPRCDAFMRRLIWGYSVWLCPTKGRQAYMG